MLPECANIERELSGKCYNSGQHNDKVTFHYNEKLFTFFSTGYHYNFSSKKYITFIVI